LGSDRAGGGAPHHVGAERCGGTIERGSVLFQIEGGDAVVLGAGQAFAEPADAVIEHFDATDEGVVFTAVFLLRADEQGELELLD
jgi:quercetin dioxygenase-like cupin family protein